MSLRYYLSQIFDWFDGVLLSCSYNNWLPLAKANGTNLAVALICFSTLVILLLLLLLLSQLVSAPVSVNPLLWDICSATRKNKGVCFRCISKQGHTTYTELTFDFAADTQVKSNPNSSSAARLFGCYNPKNGSEDWQERYLSSCQKQNWMNPRWK